jgi:L-iditol 2-dehydrogenase
MHPVDVSFEKSQKPAAPTQSMRAGVYRGPGRVILEEVQVPRISSREVLVRVNACGICGTDIKKIRHGFRPPPQIFGHEIAGTVAAVGEEVRDWKYGDRVVCFHHIPCGQCFYCEHKLLSQCATYKKVGVTAGFEPSGGGFSEYVRVMEWVARRGMVRIPPQVSFEEAVFVEPVNTCWKAVRKARVEPGEALVVLGQGPVGLLLMMLARHAGARVRTTDPMPSRRQKSLELGAQSSFDPADADLLEQVRAGTEGRGADAVIVAAPAPSLLEEALKLTRPGGRVLLFAQNDPVTRLEFPAACVGVEEKEILGSYSAAWDLQLESARLVFERVLPVRGLVTHRFPLAEIGRALALAAEPSADSLKVVLKP